MSGISVSYRGVTYKSLEEIKQAVARGELTAEQGKQFGQLFGSSGQQEEGVGTSVQQNPQQLSQNEAIESQQQRADAHQAQIAEVQQQRAAATNTAPTSQTRSTDVLREGLSSVDSKEKAKAAGFTDKTAKKVSKSAQKIEARLDKFEAVEKVFTNQEEYKAAVKAAKANGTWDKNKPKYTLLKDEALEGAKRLARDSKAQVDKTKKDYDKYAAIYSNSESTQEQKRDAFVQMCKAAEVIAKNLNAAQMFDKDGNINTKAYKDTMLQYSGTDFKGNLDERKALKESADVKNRKTKEMFRAAGLDVEKNYTGAMKVATFAGVVGTAALAGFLGGGIVAEKVAHAAATSIADATASVTVTIPAQESTGKNGEIYYRAGDEISATTTAHAETTAISEDTAKASISRGDMAKRGALIGLPAAILAAALVKDNGGKDIFNGLTAEQVLNNAKKVSGKQNREIVQKIIDLPNLTTHQKASILQAAYGDNTAKKVNEQELVAAYTAARHLNDHPEIVNPPVTTTPTTGPTTTPTTGPTTTPTTGPTTTTTTSICYDERDDKYKLPIIQYRTGTWYTAHAYVGDDGKNLTDKERAEVQRALRNQTGYSTTSTGRRDGLLIPHEITLSNGKVVKIADDAKERISRLSARGGGADAKYNVQKRGTQVRPVDCKSGQPLAGWMSEKEFEKWKQEHQIKHA